MWLSYISFLLAFQSLASGQTASSITLVGSPNPSNYGQPVTLTATVTAGATGKVTFYAGVTIIGIGTLSGGQASISTVMLPSGNRNLRAYYQGDGAYGPSSSAVVPQTVMTTSSLGFRHFTSYQGPSVATAVAVGSFRGNGHQDVVVANGTSNSISVYLGNGDGTFHNGVAYPVGNNPECVATGDFNGDGKMDLAVANGYSGNVSILRGNGDGTFQPALTQTVAGGATDLAVADFNGDGNADLVVTDGVSSAVTILLGNGDGTFQDGAVSYFAGPLEVAVADWNGDGIADLVLGFTYGNFGTLLGNGDGTFQDVVYGFFMGDEFYSLATGDFNGDGIPDVFLYPIYSGVTGNTGAVYLGKGDGTFAFPVYDYQIGSPIGSAVVEDFNGDGKLDIVYTDYASVASVALFIGNGDGTFGDAVRFLSGNVLDGNTYSPRESLLNLAAVGDFNGDGKPDLIVGGNSSTGFNFLLGGALPDLSVAVTHGAGFTQGQTGDYLITVSNVGDYATSGPVKLSAALPTGLTASSMSGNNWTCTLTTISCTRSDSLAPRTSYDVIFLQVSPASGLTGNVTSTFTVSGGGETNTSNDSTIDTAFIRYSTTTTLSASPNPSTLGGSVTLTATVTVGATGRVDFFDGTTPLGSAPVAMGQSVLTTSQLPSGSQSLHAAYPGDSNYGPSVANLNQTVTPVPEDALPPATTYQLAAAPVWMMAGDLRADGKTDLVTANYVSSTSGTVSVLLGNGDGTFSAPVNYSAGNSTVFTAVLADFNNDGNPDVAVLTYDGIVLLPGNGDGTFGTAQLVTPPAGNETLVAGDFNRDGNLDLIALTTSNTITLYLGNGDGTFQSPLTVPSTGTSYYSLAAADMNGDSKADLVATSYGGVSVFLGNGDGTFQPPLNATLSNPPYSFVVGDFTGDGRPDVAVATETDGFYVLPGNGDGTFKPAISTAPTTFAEYYPTYLIAGDFDGDGKLDVAMASGDLTLLFGKGDGTLGPAIEMSAYAGGPIASGDFNRDGKLDLAIGGTNSKKLQVLLGGQIAGLNVSSSHYGRFTAGQTGTYQITVTNLAFATTSGPVTVTDTLPSGLTATSISGTGWTCTVSRLSCTRSDGLASSSSYPTITLTVSVAAGLPASVVNNLATVTYSGIANSTTDPTTIVSPTSTALISSPNPSTLGQAVTLTATVTPGTTGRVIFLDGGAALGTAPVSNGQAALTTRLLSSGRRQLMAISTGDATHSSSRAPDAYQTVNAQPANSFSAAATYATGAGASAIAAGDFNNDGITDLVTANSVAGTISVLLGRGDGTFGAHTDYPAMASSLAVADFNNDGQPDIAAWYNNTLNILLGNPDGTFQAPMIIQIPGEGFPSSLTLAASDFNDDGKADLLLASDNVFILFGNGDGSFQAPVQIGSFISLASLGDFNQDGNVDILTGESLLLGNGDGTFQSKLGSAGGVSLLATGDVNGDGKADAVGMDASSLYGILGNGDGTFQSAIVSQTNVPNSGEEPSALVLADINGDGKLDAVALFPGNYLLVAFLGNGDGTFQPAGSYPLSGWSLVAGDFNGDGRTDLAIADSNVTVLLGVLSPALTVSSAHSDPFSIGQTTATYTITVTNSGPGVTSGTVTITDTLPAGLTATAIQGTGWTCTLATLTCTNSTALSANSSYAPIVVTVNVTAASTGSGSNGVTVSGGGAGTASASDPTSIVNPPITIQTIPSGLQFSIDSGALQTAPQTLNLPPGAHAIAVTAIQSGTPGTQYLFANWSDNGAASHTITVSASASYNATFQTQFQLTTAVDPPSGGSVTPGSYYNATASATLTATANAPMVFVGWTGATGASNPLQITINTPLSITANFDIPGTTCTMTGDATASIADVQFIVNEALGVVLANNDLNGDGVVNIADVQQVLNAAMNLSCLH